MTEAPLSLNIDQLIRSEWFLPEMLLDELAKDRDLAGHLKANVGVHYACSLRIHTLKVMECFEKHFAHSGSFDPPSRAWFRLFLALHDIGKPLAIEAGDKRWQHRFTVDLLRRTRELYPVSVVEFEDMVALVDGDPIGAYLKGECGRPETVALIRQMASRSSMKPDVFYRRLVIYYQCDASGYTRRAGLMGMLDALFEWDGDEIRRDPAAGRLVFSERIGSLMGCLEKDLFPTGGAA